MHFTGSRLFTINVTQLISKWEEATGYNGIGIEKRIVARGFLEGVDWNLDSAISLYNDQKDSLHKLGLLNTRESNKGTNIISLILHLTKNLSYNNKTCIKCPYPKYLQ